MCRIIDPPLSLRKNTMLQNRIGTTLLAFFASAFLFAFFSPAPASAPASAATVQQTYHVSPDGSDDNPGSEEKPFAGVDRARRAVQLINKNMSGDIVVVLHDGEYQIDHTIVFKAEDSGTNGRKVIYRAAANATPVISGGRRVVGWEKCEKGIWKAPAPIDNFRQLYVGGRRATRARGDAPAGLELLDDKGYTTTDVRMAEWKNASDVEFCYRTIWAHTRCKVNGIKREGDRAVITMLQPHFANAINKEGVQIANPDHLDGIHVENALELLDEPGEWYLDRPAKTVYYMPLPGEDMSKVEAIVPALEKLVELRGEIDRPVQNIRFEGITFAHGSWLLPSEIGFVDVQANFVLDWQKPFHRGTGLTAVHNEHLKSPSNVVCRACDSIHFERCTFAKLGGGGIDLEYGSRNNVIQGCIFKDISGTAVQVGDVLKDDHHPDDPKKIVKNNSVTNNYIRDCGLEYWGSVGVFAGYTEGTVISHNEICYLPYSGISSGWGWGEEDAGGGNPDYEQPFKYETPTPAKNNRIEYNHIHNVMSRTDDGAGVYTLGNQPGTVIRGNYIHDCASRDGKRGWIQGIYLDEGSGFIEVVGNLVLGMNPTHFNNKAQDRISTCKVHDNYFLGAEPKANDEDYDTIKQVKDAAGLEPPYRDLPPKSE